MYHLFVHAYNRRRALPPVEPFGKQPLTKARQGKGMKTSVSQEKPSSLLPFSNKAFIVKHLLKHFVEKYLFFQFLSTEVLIYLLFWC